jgi:invasion protein IalB
LPQIAPRFADRVRSAGRGTAALCALALLALSPDSVVRAQETGTPQTGGAQTGALAAGGTRLGRTTTAPPPPSAPGIEVRQFQDWAVRCGAAAEGAPTACEMLQQRQDEQGQTVLAIAVGDVPNNDNPGMLIILPLGIELPPGAALKIGQGDDVPAQIRRCMRHGCEVELLLEPAILARLKAGTEANVLFQIVGDQGQPRTVGVPFSLLGFTAALEEIKG